VQLHSPDHPWLRRVIQGTVFLLSGLAIFVAGIGVGYQLAPQQGRESRKENETGQQDRLAQSNATAPEVKPKERLLEKKESSSRPKEPARPENRPETEPPAKPAPQVTFATHILPIFRAKCISCHGGRKTKGALDLTTVAALLEGGDSGPGIKTGDVEGSVLWTYIVTDKMPPGRKKRKKLTATEKETIREWILSAKTDIQRSADTR
jgi:hypothetical protein